MDNNPAEKERIEEGEAHCKTCSGMYPVREGIGMFLTDELSRNDLWEQIDSGLMKYLKSNPEQYKQLMTPALDALPPADQFLRGMILEEQGRFAEAKKAHNTGMQGLYTAEYLDCFQRQVDYVVNQLSSGESAIVDLAPGRCYLVEQLAAKLDRSIVATDFSPRVLRQARKKLEFEGLYDKVSVLVFDARRTPFHDHCIEILTTNLGLPNTDAAGVEVDSGVEVGGMEVSVG